VARARTEARRVRRERSSISHLYPTVTPARKSALYSAQPAAMSGRTIGPTSLS
jgi:hypothetical protein